MRTSSKFAIFSSAILLGFFQSAASADDIVRPGAGDTADVTIEEVKPKAAPGVVRPVEEVEQGLHIEEFVTPDGTVKPVKKKPSMKKMETIRTGVHGSKPKKGMEEYRPQVEEIKEEGKMREWLMLEKMGTVKDSPAPPPPPPPSYDDLYEYQPPEPEPVVIKKVAKKTVKKAKVTELSVVFPGTPQAPAPLVGSCESSSLLPIYLLLATYWFFHYRRRAA